MYKKIINNNYFKYVVIIFIIIICFVIYTVYRQYKRTDTIIDIPNIEVTDNKNDTNIEEKENSVVIDIKGAVKKPGVYSMNSGSRVNDAVNKSGGLTSNADTSVINLSKLIHDEMVIIIYTKEEIKSMSKDNIVVKYIEKECICPDVVNDACINQEANDDTSNNSLNKISLNKASVSELETLPGIGNSKALEIIQYRETNGGFKSVEELKEINGIGISTFEKIKDLVTI